MIDHICIYIMLRYIIDDVDQTVYDLHKLERLILMNNKK